MINKIKLDKIIDINILQNIQNIFSKATHVATITVDYEGNPITEPSCFTDFCNTVRSDEKLREKCYKCDAYGGIQALINRKPYIYKCHAGLYDFSVPIVIEDKYIGAIMSGQVKLSDAEKYDDEIGSFGKASKWSGEDLEKKYNSIEVRSYKDLESAANLIYQISKYMVDHEFISLIKKELANKTTELMEEENKRIKLEKALKETELKALKYQINPNFMFNVLNTIGNLAYIEDAPKTQVVIQQFSDVIKYSLKENDTKNTYLQYEIGYVENYMEIQKFRFAGNINYSIDIDEKYYCLKCPYMILQPIVENFIKYVVEKKVDGGNLIIKGYPQNNDFIIHIEDDGYGMSQEQINNVLSDDGKNDKAECNGLYNINKRLVYLYGPEYKLRIYGTGSQKNGLLIKIAIPMIEGEVYV